MTASVEASAGMAAELVAVGLRPLALPCVRIQQAADADLARARASVEEADLVVANIHYEVIQKILGNKGFRERGWFIISGLMRSQVQEVKWQMEKYDLQVIHEWDNDMTWYTILAENSKLAPIH